MEAEVKQQENINSSVFLKNTLHNLALLFSLVTAITFYNGFFYYGSYQWYWGLSLDLSLVNFEEILIRGVEVYWLIFVEYIANIKFLGFVVAPVVLLLIVFFLLSDRARPTVNKFFDYCDNRLNFKQAQHEIIDSIVTYLTFVGAVFVVLCLLMFLRTYAVEQGGKAAQKHQNNIIEGVEAQTPFRLNRLTYLDELNQPNTIETYLISASATHQAFYVDPDVLVLPISRILAIRNIGVKPEEEATVETEVAK